MTKETAYFRLQEKILGLNDQVNHLDQEISLIEQQLSDFYANNFYAPQQESNMKRWSLTHLKIAFSQSFSNTIQNLQKKKRSLQLDKDILSKNAADWEQVLKAVSEDYISLELRNTLLPRRSEFFDMLRHFKIVSLTIRDSTIPELAAGIGELRTLRLLYINNCELEVIPHEIAQLTNLDILSLYNNKISYLPEAIGEIVGLRKLDLHGNQLSELPKATTRLVHLHEFNLAENQFSTFPSELCDLYQLTDLSIAGNLIVSLPSEVGRLKLLKRLDLGDTSGGNKLVSLPNEIIELSNLELLAAMDNSLIGLPKGLEKLTKLKSLYLRNNNIDRLDSGLTSMSEINHLDLVNNPLSIPPEIISNTISPKLIFDYYFATKQRLINESKILMVGQGGVGKTSLIRRLQEGEFSNLESKTDGIAILRWQVDNQHEGEHQASPIQLNVWDFGGQEIMHATHQFFLTKRSLYVLILDCRLTQEENRVEYWLKIIQSFGGESPVLIVGNKIDQHPLDIDRTGLQKKYANIVGILETSAATEVGIEELKTAITQQVNALPHVRDLLPETWFTIKTKLEELGNESNFITHDKYLELCAENKVSDETSQRTLIGFLHDLGVILHFQEDPRLEALGILNPQWVTNGVYKILNSHALFQNRGALQRPMLDEILNSPEYPANKRIFIVDMMRKFELCYDIEADRRFLIPDLLPKDEPETGDWSNALAFQYHYTVLPSSILTRFIVRMNGFIHEIVWRSGVVLKNGGNTALVKADMEERKVYIWVSGDEHSRRDFLAKIRGEFDAIHKTIAKIEAREKVPVPGHPEAEPVDYDLLLQMEHNNVEVYPVMAGGKMIVVNVRELLSGVVRESDRQRGGNVYHIHVDGDFVQDKQSIEVGDINDASGVAVGHGAKSNVEQRAGRDGRDETNPV